MEIKRIIVVNSSMTLLSFGGIVLLIALTSVIIWGIAMFYSTPRFSVAVITAGILFIAISGSMLYLEYSMQTVDNFNGVVIEKVIDEDTIYMFMDDGTMYKTYNISMYPHIKINTTQNFTRNYNEYYGYTHITAVV